MASKLVVGGETLIGSYFTMDMIKTYKGTLKSACAPAHQPGGQATEQVQAPFQPAPSAADHHLKVRQITHVLTGWTEPSHGSSGKCQNIQPFYQYLSQVKQKALSRAQIIRNSPCHKMVYKWVLQGLDTEQIPCTWDMYITNTPYTLG